MKKKEYPYMIDGEAVTEKDAMNWLIIQVYMLKIQVEKKEKVHPKG